MGKKLNEETDMKVSQVSNHWPSWAKGSGFERTPRCLSTCQAPRLWCALGISGVRQLQSSAILPLPPLGGRGKMAELRKETSIFFASSKQRHGANLECLGSPRGPIQHSKAFGCDLWWRVTWLHCVKSNCCFCCQTWSILSTFIAKLHEMQCVPRGTMAEQPCLISKQPCHIFSRSLMAGWWDGMQPVAGNERLPSDVLCLKDIIFAFEDALHSLRTRTE